MTWVRECALAAAACAAAALLFVAPWRPNRSTIPLTYPPGGETEAAADAAVWMHVQAEGARNLAAVLRGEDRSWFDAPFLHPLPAPLAMMDHRFSEGLWAAPLFLRLEPPVAWGWLLLLSVWLTALAAYAAGRAVTASAWGGAAAAVLFAFGPHAAGRLPFWSYLLAPAWVPLLVAALVRLVEAPTRGRAVATGAAAAACAVEYPYNALHVALLLPLALGLSVARRRLPVRDAVVALGTAAALAAPVLLPAAAAYARFHAETGIERRAAHVAQGAADVWSWLVAPDASLIVAGGPRVASHLPHPGSFLFPGIAACALGLAGARALGRRAPEAWLVAAGAFVLTFGTAERLLWSIGLPPAAVGPYALLRLLPAGRAFGTPTTAAPFVGAGIALAGALAAARLAGRGRAGRAAAATVLVLAFAEGRLAVREAAIRPARADDPAYAWVAARAADGDGAVLDAPMGRIVERDGHRLEIDSLWAARLHGLPTPNGTTTTVVPWHDAIAAHLAAPRTGVADVLLRALGVRWVVARDAATAAAFERLGLAVAHGPPDGARVLEVPAPGAVRRGLDPLRQAMRAATHRTLADPARGRGSIEAPARLAVPAQAPFEIPIVVANLGPETWCAHAALFPPDLGVRDVRAGIAAWEGLGAGETAPVDFTGRPLSGRGFLPHDLAPGETAAVRLHAQAPRRSGRYRLALGLVVEEVGWLPGSPQAVLDVEVGPPVVPR